MATTYPANIDSFTNPTATDQMDSPPHAEQHADANDAITAIQTELGVTPSGSETTVAARFAAAESDISTLTDGVAASVEKAGDTMTGALVLPATDPVTSNEATRKLYVDDLVGGRVDKTGDTMTGALTLPGTDPTVDNDAARKAYVDGRVLKAGDTMTGALTLPGSDPTTDNQASRKAYVDARVLKSGDTMTGNLITPGVELGVSALGTSGTVTLDMNANDFATTGTLSGDVTFGSSNRSAGRSATIRVVNGSTLRTLSFPSGWRFVGAKPVDIAASKTGVLTITAFGPNDADVVAAWGVEE